MFRVVISSSEIFIWVFSHKMDSCNRNGWKKYWITKFCNLQMVTLPEFILTAPIFCSSFTVAFFLYVIYAIIFTMFPPHFIATPWFIIHFSFFNFLNGNSVDLLAAKSTSFLILVSHSILKYFPKYFRFVIITTISVRTYIFLSKFIELENSSNKNYTAEIYSSKEFCIIPYFCIRSNC